MRGLDACVRLIAVIFKNHFSGHADRYGIFHQTYPAALSGYLASLRHPSLRPIADHRACILRQRSSRFLMASCSLGLDPF
jgi:hypothetical protein